MLLFCFYGVISGEQRWSASFLSQASELSCEPGKVRRNATFLHGTKSGNFTKLGKVSDLEVCTLLCCELDRCQAAFLAGTNCYAVTCFTKNHCATVPALNNKWQPMVAFVKRFNKVAHVEAGKNRLLTCFGFLSVSAIIFFYIDKFHISTVYRSSIRNELKKLRNNMSTRSS